MTKRDIGEMASTRRASGLVAVVLAFAACQAPNTPNSSADAWSTWEHWLEKKKVLSLNPNSSIAIKRDVHSIDIGADAGPFAQAFEATLADPSKHFGLIYVMRERAHIGKPFTVGERFQGRYSIEDALRLTDPFWQDFLRPIEDKLTSDYGIIRELKLDPAPGEDHELVYQYLEGSPIAGSSTFVVHQLAPKRCRLTQIFEYQELDQTFIPFFANDGLKLHDQVVYSQARQAAERIGVAILGTDIPSAYFDKH